MSIKRKFTELSNIIFIGVGITIVVPAIVIWFFYDRNQSSVAVWSMGFTLMGAIANIVAVVIALIIYKRYAIDDRKLERQIEKVEDLVDFLKENRICIDSFEGGSLMRYRIVDLSRKIIKKEDKISPYLKNSICCARRNVDDFLMGLNVRIVNKDIPKSIRDKSRFTQMYEIKYNKGPVKDLNQCTKVTFNNVSEKELYFMQMGDESDSDYIENIILHDFLMDLADFVNSVKNWIENHSSDSQYLYDSPNYISRP